MLKKRLARLLCISVVVVMLVLPFMSCGDKKVEETVTYTLKIGTVSQPTTNNPFAIGIGVSDAEHMQMLYEPLVRVMFSSDPVPLLAKSWSYDTATMTWTLKLNPDAKFSDGSKVTAQDVEWTLEKQVELKLGLVSNLITVLGDATANPNPINAPDSETVTVKLKTFAATFIRYLGNTSIVPKVIWSGMTNEALTKYANADPVGSGPYKLKERVENSHVIYTARPEYWGGKPPIDTIQLLWYATNEGQLLAIKAGDIDCISVFSLATAVPQLLGNSDITVFQVASNTTVTLYPNHRFAPWNLVAFRKAASLAINRQDQITYAVSGWGTVPAMIERDPAFEDVKAIYNDVKWPGLAYTTQAARITEANKMLDAIPGMTTIAGGDGTYRKYNGKLLEFKLECASDFASQTIAATEAAKNLKDIGIKMNVSPTTASVLVGKTARQKSDATASDWETYVWGRAFTSDYDYFANQWQSFGATESTRLAKRSWIVGWTDAQGVAIGDKLAQLQALPEGDATRNALIADTMKQWAAQLPAIPLYTNIIPAVHRNDKFTGWVEDNGYIYYGSIQSMGAIYNFMNLKPVPVEK